MTTRTGTYIILKSAREIATMRTAGQIVARTLALLREHIRPGVSTGHLDALAEEAVRKEKAIPSFKGYHNFPASLCLSVNEEIVHGIPGKRVLNDGDIISIDLGVIYQGYQGDSAITVGVGDISPAAARLLADTEEALYRGIEQARTGRRLGDISYAVQRYSQEKGYGLVREYVGHGIGRAMHEDPQVPNHGQPGKGPILRAGMTLAIEPMFNIGGDDTESLSDGWTVVTKDRSLSAHFEHTVAIGNDGPDILTKL